MKYLHPIAWENDVPLTPTRFIVMTRSAGMPSSCWGSYRRVAVVETDLEQGEPRMISIRSRHVIRIMQTWERCSAPRGGKDTQYTRALAEAEAIAARLNSRKKRRAA